MHVTFIVVSIILGLVMAGTGVPKLLQLRPTRASAEHLGVSVSLDRMIGVAEIAAAIGLSIGIASPLLSIVTGAAVCLLMCGALGYHLKVRDKISAMLPAVLTAGVAIAVVALAAAAPASSLSPMLHVDR